jgi:hypothetical protein
MSKKSFTDPDELVSGLDDLASEQPKSGRGRGKRFTQEPEVDARDIAVATADRSMAGQYKRKQILIPPGQLAFIRDKAKELGVSQAELFRWLIDYGLTALDEGVKPEIEVVDVRGETKKSHWTSK